MFDPFFRVETIASTPLPNFVCYKAMKQCYRSGFVEDYFENSDHTITDKKTSRVLFHSNAGDMIVKALLKGNKGHWGIFEHVHIVLNCGGFPHSVMQQLRTHRNVSFAVQSFRYTSLLAVESPDDVESVIYLRPVGTYTNRTGSRYVYTQTSRLADRENAYTAIKNYQYALNVLGHSEEHARGLIPFDVRQNWVISGNARAILHLCDVRGKKDVQLETRECVTNIFKQFCDWMPEVGEWYKNYRWEKGILAP
jgi:thymidylate synthase (FAD)